MTRTEKAKEACGFDYEIGVVDFGTFVEVTGSIGGDIVRKEVYFNNDGSIAYITAG